MGRKNVVSDKNGRKTMSILNDISENLQRGKAKVVKELVQQAIDEGIPVQQILNEGLLSGMARSSRTTRCSCLRCWWRPAP